VRKDLYLVIVLEKVLVVGVDLALFRAQEALVRPARFHLEKRRKPRVARRPRLLDAARLAPLLSPEPRHGAVRRRHAPNDRAKVPPQLLMLILLVVMIFPIMHMVALIQPCVHIIVIVDEKINRRGRTIRLG
jgi:hypothetical protein